MRYESLRYQCLYQTTPKWIKVEFQSESALEVMEPALHMQTGGIDWYLCLWGISLEWIWNKRTARYTKLPLYAGPGKGQTPRVYCKERYPAFLQEAVSTAWTCDLLVAWLQLYHLRQGSLQLSTTVNCYVLYYGA